MSAFLGKYLSINEYESKRDFGEFYAPVPIKKAQQILAQGDERADSAQLRLLCRQLYYTVLRYTLESGDILRQSTQVVVDWHNDLPNVPFAVHKGFNYMEKLTFWQKAFVQLLQKQENSLEFHLFNDGNIPHVWLVISNSFAEEILTYSKLYIDFLKDNPENYFEFLIYGKDELDRSDLPKETISVISED